MLSEEDKETSAGMFYDACAEMSTRKLEKVLRRYRTKPVDKEDWWCAEDDADAKILTDQHIAVLEEHLASRRAGKPLGVRYWSLA